MFSPGNILYFDDFTFTDGSSKPKYFLVVKEKEEGVIILSLPSSQKKLPGDTILEHGCLNIPQKGIGCYIFLTDIPITECGFSFPLVTYLYAEQITDLSVEDLKNFYDPSTYSLKGKLKESEHQKIIECVKASHNLKKKYRQYL